jgi:hypothetical protein
VTADEYDAAELNDQGNEPADLDLNRDFTDLVLAAVDLLEEQSRQLVEIAIMDSDIQLEAIRARRLGAKLRRMIRGVRPKVDRQDLNAMEIDKRIKVGSWVKHMGTGEEWRVDDMEDTQFLSLCVWLQDG